MVVTLCLAENSVGENFSYQWNESGKIESSITEGTKEIAFAYQYDASGYAIVPNNGGHFADITTKHIDEFDVDDVADAFIKHKGLISNLKNGAVEIPRGQASAKMLGELTLATSSEVALWRVGRKRFLTLGGRRNIAPLDGATRLIAHTHPSGLLKFSNHVNALGQRKGDIAAFAKFFPNQKSSVLIGPSGAGKRLSIP